MSLSDIVGGSQGLLDGQWVFSKFRLKDFAEAEQEFIADYLATAGLAADRLPAKTADVLLDKATGLVARGHLSFGSPEYNLQAFLEHRLPFLLWVCLKVKHADIKREQAEALITDDNRATVHKKVLQCMGYVLPNAEAAKPPAAANPPQNPTPTAGETSSAPSASPDSPTTQSTT